MKWLIEILMAHKRLRGLDEKQLQELIRNVDDVDALGLIKKHLESGNFRYPHLEGMAPQLIQQCVTKAKEQIWLQHAGELKRAFMEHLGDII